MAWARIGAPVTFSTYGNPFSVFASTSTSTGLVNLRTIARSSRSTRHNAKTPLASISSCVNAPCSTLIPIHFGSNEICVTQFMVMPLRRSPRSVVPTT
jgi:hypothetical protein